MLQENRVSKRHLAMSTAQLDTNNNMAVCHTERDNMQNVLSNRTLVSEDAVQVW